MDSKGNIHKLTEEQRKIFEDALGEKLAPLTDAEAEELKKLPREERAKLYDELMARAFNAHADNAERNAAKRERKSRK